MRDGGGLDGGVDASFDGSLDAEPNDAEPNDGGTSEVRRIPDRAIVRWLQVEPPWWIEERLAPQPKVEGDRDLGPRAIVRAAPERTIVWQPDDTDRLVDGCMHPDGTWSAVGVDAGRRIFVARGGSAGLSVRALLDDPTLRDEPLAWLDAPKDTLRVGSLSEASPKIACEAEHVWISLMSEDNAVLLYRGVVHEGAWDVTQRTVVAPAMVVTPFLPIGGSYDDFDAVVAPYVTHLARDTAGRVFVAWQADRSRVARYNATFGTELSLLREELHPREATLDTFVVGLDPDGTRAFAVVVGIPDVEDEVFGLALGPTRVAVLGRHRRELGRDNTELHAMIAELSHDGVPIAATSFDAADSALAQSGAYDGDTLYVGGSEGWRQNPSGRSVFEPGAPFLVRLEGSPRRIEREDVPSTSGHAELRALALDRDTLLLGGHENGPLTHTADSDPSRVRSDAWWVARPR